MTERGELHPPPMNVQMLADLYGAERYFSHSELSLAAGDLRKSPFPAHPMIVANARKALILAEVAIAHQDENFGVDEQSVWEHLTSDLKGLLHPYNNPDGNMV